MKGDEVKGDEVKGDEVGRSILDRRIPDTTNIALNSECGGQGTDRPTSATQTVEAPRFYSNSPTIIRLSIDHDVLAAMPETLEPTYLNAKTLFDAITEKTKNREDANLVWTLMAAKIGPMQIDFTSEQWGEMIEKIRKLKSCTFVVRNRRVDYSSLRVEE